MEYEGLEKALVVLKSAESDNERLATLLLVTKLVKSEDCDSETRRQIFDAVGFTFLNRLLRSNKAPDDCCPNSYKSLAVTILACFCTDVELSVHPDLLSLIPKFNEFLCLNPSLPEESSSEADRTDLNLVDDTYQCLLAICNEPEGRSALLSNKTIKNLCLAVLQNYYGSDKALQIILTLSHHCGSATWKDCAASCDSLILKYAKKFQENQEEEKFQLCSLLQNLLTSVTGMKFGRVLPSWSSSIHSGLQDILQSKVAAHHRESALKLASTVVECLGVRWTILGNPTDEKSRKFLLILVHLTCIEVRMTLENGTHEQINEKSGLLSACYSLLEHIIAYMTSCTSMNLDEKQVKQLHSAMVGAFNAVILFLDDVSTNEDHKISKMLEYGTIRVLGSWMAEETTALRQDVYNILPYLLKISKQNFENIKSQVKEDEQRNIQDGDKPNVSIDEQNQTVTVDVFRFLLPSICHFSAEDISRKLIVENKGHVLLGDYLRYMWQKFVQTKLKDCKVAMTTICGIFMNFAVLEPRMVAQQQVFCELLHFLTMSLPDLAYDHSNLMLTGNFVVLGLMLSRHQANNLDIPETEMTKFFSAIVHFLSSAHVSGDPIRGLIIADDYTSVWGHLAELWFLGMQAIAACVPLFSWLPHTILKSGWIPSLLKNLIDTKGGQTEREVLVAYGTLLGDLASKKGLARQVITEKGGKQVAQMYKMEHLEKYLSSKS